MGWDGFDLHDLVRAVLVHTKSNEKGLFSPRERVTWYLCQTGSGGAGDGESRPGGVSAGRDQGDLYNTTRIYVPDDEVK